MGVQLLQKIWKEIENQIRVRYKVIVKITYHNVIMGFKEELYKNHAAINTIIMADKRRMCYKERLKCYNPSTISGIIEGRIKMCWGYSK